MRIRLTVIVLPFLFTAYCTSLAAQNNPVPFVHNPLAPASAMPGSAGLTLTVNGAGFVSGAVVNWNGSARPTTFVSPARLTAAIPASDLVTLATVPVTVSNPAPGGGTSNAVLFEVTTPTTSLAFNRTDTDFSFLDNGNPAIQAPSAFAVGYLPGIAEPYLEIASSGCPALSFCIFDHGYITSVYGFRQALTVGAPNSVVTGDFNGDGIFDLISFSTMGNTFSVSLAGTTNLFNNPQSYSLPGDVNPYVIPVVGDFNRDGKLDLVMAGNTGVYFMAGNGDGTFGAPVLIVTDASAQGGTQVVAGDFNGDGILDLVVSNSELMGGSISVLVGNGDGTFQLRTNIPANFVPTYMQAADFNGDGKLDLVGFLYSTSSASMTILLGNGDGTFQPGVEYPAGISPIAFALGDYNGDGRVDMAITDSLCTSAGCPANGVVHVLLGNSDGTFQSNLDFAASQQLGDIAAGEFSYLLPPVGLEGFAVANSLSNTVSMYTAVQPAGTTNPLPTISSISPEFAVEGSGAFTLTVNGTNFVSGSSGSAVSFGSQAEPSTFVSATQLTAQIPANAVASVGAVPVLVNTPVPGGGNSTSAIFSVYYPPPAISSISVTSVVAGSPAFALTINGMNFVTGATLNFNGATQPSTFVSSTLLTTTVAASSIATPGTIAITVANPALGINFSGGGTSPAVLLTILASNTQPAVGGLSPASATAGGPTFTLTIIGTGFSAASVVTFGAATVSAAYDSNTPNALQASIPASDIAVAGTPLVSVKNPGGSASVPISFIVNNPVPALASLSPPTAAPGSGAVTLNVTGVNFNSSSVLQVGGASLATTLVSSTVLTALLPSSYITPGATLNIAVNNPPPGGGTTSALIFAVTDFNVSAAVSTATVTAGQPASFMLAIAPANTALGGAVTFTASGVPPNATPTFSPSSLPAGTKSTNVTLSIATMAHSAGVGPLLLRIVWPRPFLLCAIAISICLTWWGCWVASVRARRFTPQFLVVMLLLIASALAACGGATPISNPQVNPATGTPAGTYQIVVTAASGSASLTTKVTLTVQ